ncbi:MAG: hypothetical protein PHV95_02035 [Eubacteriales bacterium]|nr:hypothetical protein [Eubacteriales bacterium]
MTTNINIESSAKESSFFKRNLPFLIVIAAVLVCYILPLLPIQVPLGHDIYFHMERIESLADSIKAGDIFPRIYTTSLNDQGYASPMFYGDLFLRIPAMLVILGMSVPMAYKVFIMLIALATAIVAYFCFNAIIGNKTSAAVGTLLYALSSYLATDFFWRAAIGEAQVFIFIPLAFLGFHNILFGDKKKWYLLPLGLFFMLQCHLLSTVTFVVILAVYALFYFDTFIKEPKRLLYIFISAAVFFAISAYFIFPMLEQLNNGEFYASDGISAVKWGTLERRAMPWWTIFSDFNNSGYYDFGVYIPNGVGLVIVPIWIYYFLYRKALKGTKALTTLIFGTVITFLTTELFPWRFFQSFFGVMQFPWRLIVFAVFFLSLAASYIVAHADKKSVFTVSMVFVIVSGFSFLMTVSGKYESMMKRAVKNEVVNYKYTNNIGGATEYLPSGTSIQKIYSFDKEIKTNNEYLSLSMDKKLTQGTFPGIYTGEMKVKFSDNNLTETYIDLPLVMYKGYSAVTDDGKQLEVGYGYNNRVRVTIGDLNEGSITVKYIGTPTQSISDVISIVSLIILLAYILYKKYGEKLKFFAA